MRTRENVVTRGVNPNKREEFELELSSTFNSVGSKRELLSEIANQRRDFRVIAFLDKHDMILNNAMFGHPCELNTLSSFIDEWKEISEELITWIH